MRHGVTSRSVDTGKQQAQSEKPAGGLPAKFALQALAKGVVEFHSDGRALNAFINSEGLQSRAFPLGRESAPPDWPACGTWHRPSPDEGPAIDVLPYEYRFAIGCSQPAHGGHVVSDDRRGRIGPRPLNEIVQRQMRAMPRSNTAVERALRRELHRLGLRYRVHLRDLPGTPDIALTKARVAVFVDGCFWHRCPEHGTSPKNNSAWWAAKLDGNVARDRRKDIQLQELGWVPIHVWEHENPTNAAAKIHKIWRERIGPAAGQTYERDDM
jgi:DNA mismatch endonuclease, patch repair protein